MGLPFEVSWKRVANQRLVDFYRLDPSADPEDLRGIDRFVKVDLRNRVFEGLGHRYVCELQQRLTVRPETRRLSRAEWRAFLEVPESTLSRWRHDQHLAGAQNYFAVHHLRLNVPVGSIPFPPHDVMLKEAVVSVLRHIRYKYLGEGEPLLLTASTVDHVVNLMHLMGRHPHLTYNPFDEGASRTNRAGLRRYAEVLFRRREARTIDRLSPGEVEAGVGRLTDEAQTWLDEWGLAYTLLAVGYRTGWTGMEGTA